MNKVIVSIIIACNVVFAHAQPWLTGTGTIFSNPTTSKVGIGTNSPRGKLDVSGGDTYLTTSTLSSSENLFLPGHIYLIPRSSSDICYIQGRRSDNSGSTHLQFRTTNSGLVVDGMRLNSLGNFCIGNTVFDSQNRYKFEVNGKAKIYDQTVIMGSSSTDMLDISNNQANVASDKALIWGAYGWGSSQPNNPKLFDLTQESNHRFVVRNNGQVGVNCDPGSSTYSLTVNGKVLAEGIDLIGDVPNSDFVFKEGYNLISIEDLEDFINEKKHLPEIPSAEEFKTNGYNVGKMDDLLLRKIEELSLYIIQLNNENKRLRELIEK